MESSTFSFQLTPTDPTAQLGFECWINDQCIFATDHVTEAQSVVGNLPNDVGTEHTLKLVLKHKTSEHTKISDSGEILDDACLEVSGLAFDDIELGFNILEMAVYCHNYNDTAQLDQHKFFKIMGCNGTVTLKFSTPIYIWLLEHM